MVVCSLTLILVKALNFHPVKFEPQWLHWCHEAITVHSGMVKLHGKTSSYHPYVSDDKKNTTQHSQHMSSRKCLKQWRTYPKVASSKVTTVLLNVNQPSISTISRIFVKRSMSSSFAYSLWPDMVKGRSTMLGDWQNTLHVHMWEHRVKFLMPLLYRFSWN